MARLEQLEAWQIVAHTAMLAEHQPRSTSAPRRTLFLAITIIALGAVLVTGSSTLLAQRADLLHQGERRVDIASDGLMQLINAGVISPKDHSIDRAAREQARAYRAQDRDLDDYLRAQQINTVVGALGTVLVGIGGALAGAVWGIIHQRRADNETNELVVAVVNRVADAASVRLLQRYPDAFAPLEQSRWAADAIAGPAAGSSGS